MSVSHLFVDFNKLLLSFLFFSVCCLIQNVSVECIEYILTLRVGYLWSTSHFKENYFDCCHKNDDKFIEIVVSMVIEQKIEEEVCGKIVKKKLTGNHAERVNHQKHPKGNSCFCLEDYGPWKNSDVSGNSIDTSEEIPTCGHNQTYYLYVLDQLSRKPVMLI